MYAQGETVVVEQAARWHAAAEEQHVVSLFTLHGGTITRVVRYDDLAAALKAGGLDEP
jgi:hypothetical protein